MIDRGATIANMLVRAVQDVGVSDVVSELLAADRGSEIYRVPIAEDFIGKTYREYAIAMLDTSCSVVGLALGTERSVNPPPSTVLTEAHDAFVIAREPPR